MGVVEATRWLFHALDELLYPEPHAIAQHRRPAQPGGIERLDLERLAASWQIDTQRPRCQRCAMPVGPFAAQSPTCYACARQPLSFERVLCLGGYDGSLRQACLLLKSATHAWLARVLADLWVERHGSDLCNEVGGRPPLVIPVPLHWRRRWQRGYNQAEALARRIAQRLGWPHRPGCLRRVRHTRHAAGLARAQRLDLLRNAYRAERTDMLQGATVLLVDDVMTTGSTAHEAARPLKRAGADRIIVAVLARTED